MTTLFSSPVSLLSFMSSDPLALLLQISVLTGAMLLVFLVFYATKDILNRSQSFMTQFGSILLVALFPVAGFCFYLLVRPSSTIRERAIEDMLREVLDHLQQDTADTVEKDQKEYSLHDVKEKIQKKAERMHEKGYKGEGKKEEEKIKEKEEVPTPIA